MTRESSNFILQICSALPHLTELSLVETGTSTEEEQSISGLEFLRNITSELASPKREIERLSITNIHEPFSSELGGLFASLRSLKFLRLGDADGSNGPYGGDGRLDFESYGPVGYPCLACLDLNSVQEVLNFIKALPQSLQEIYLEIHAHDVFCDEDEDFDPVCKLGPEIFGTLKGLHTCDIHAWISNLDGGLGSIPEKAVFYRRHPYHCSSGNKNIKEIWTSRMGCIYQEDDERVIKYSNVVKGDFEGEDAEEVWLGGYTNAKAEEEEEEGQGEEEEQGYSWPKWVNKVHTYPIFRSRT